MDKSRINVLVVDDEQDILDSMKTHLELDGYQVEICESADLAIEKIRNSRIDIVLTDINMPDKDGIQMLEEIKMIRGETIVIMMTAYTSLLKVLNSRSHGAYDYMLKPFKDLTEVDEVLERATETLARWEMVVKETRRLKKEKAS